MLADRLASLLLFFFHFSGIPQRGHFSGRRPSLPSVTMHYLYPLFYCCSDNNKIPRRNHQHGAPHNTFIRRSIYYLLLVKKEHVTNYRLLWPSCSLCKRLFIYHISNCIVFHIIIFHALLRSLSLSVSHHTDYPSIIVFLVRFTQQQVIEWGFFSGYSPELLLQQLKVLWHKTGKSVRKR